MNREEILNELANEYARPPQVSAAPRVLGGVFVFLGVLLFTLGIFLICLGLVNRGPAAPDGFVQGISALGQAFSVYLGIVVILYSLLSMALGLILISHAEIRLGLAQNRQLLAAILEANLRTPGTQYTSQQFQPMYPPPPVQQTYYSQAP